MGVSREELLAMLPDDHPTKRMLLAAKTAQKVNPMKSPAGPRRVAGVPNKLEARFAREVILPAIARGEITWHGFEKITLRLAKATRYTPDWDCVDVDGRLIFYETKGFWMDDARVKIKVAKEMYPMWRFVGVMWDRRRKQWQYEEF